MRIDIVTIFPEIFGDFLAASLIGKAIANGLLEVRVFDLREFTDDRHRSVDDEPYGGEAGMVMTAPPLLAALRALREDEASTPPRELLMSPQGRRLDERLVREIASEDRLVLVCGRYEGVDERFLEISGCEEISLGDFVLSGGEVAAMVIVEAVSRQIPGVVQRQSSVENDSFRDGLLDWPHYTRPAMVEGREVPKILLSGDHGAIAAWRRQQALERTRKRRPDLLEDHEDD